MMLCTTMVHNIVRDVAGGGGGCVLGEVVWWGRLCGGGGCVLGEVVCWGRLCGGGGCLLFFVGWSATQRPSKIDFDMISRHIFTRKTKNANSYPVNQIVTR